MSAESIFEALGELEEDLVREAVMPPRPRARPRRFLLIAAAVILAALLAAATYAVPLARRFRTAAGDEILVGEDGHRGLRMGGEETCFVRDGRIYMVLDGKERDITNKCSETEYYAWEHTYDDGTRLLIVAGGTPERMGYFYVYFFPNWSPYTGREAYELPCFYDYANAPWAAKAEKDYALEFLSITAAPDHGDLDVPSLAELIEHGYPVNARGETYGPGGRYAEWLGQPDLELAVGKNGTEGYIRYTELEEASGGSVRTPEEAVAWNEYVRQRGPAEIPVYREDGETVVDWFVIGAGFPSEG